MSTVFSKECFEKAKRIVERFVQGSWHSRWEDMIEKRNRRDGCILDALRIKCHGAIRSAICRHAASAIRSRHPNLSSEKRNWEGKKALWSDEEIIEIVKIIATSAEHHGVIGIEDCQSCIEQIAKKGNVGDCLSDTSVHTQGGVMSKAMSVVREFAKLSYNKADWEKLIGQSDLQPHGCLINVLSIECPSGLRDQAISDGALALRKRFPEYSSPVVWRDKRWDDKIVAKIIAIVKDAIDESLIKYLNYVDEIDEVTIQNNSNPEQVGLYTPWCFFRERGAVSQLPGVYLIAYFEESPPVKVAPLSKNVIYIGITESQSLYDRLSQFEETALGGLGHSGGFSYRTVFVPKVFDNNNTLLKRFHNTFCSWREVPGTSTETPREIERTLLQDYKDKWGGWPLLNKQG